ncbi:phosphotransferase [Nonomuraea sp. NPDC046570]|uniref:phosphotransferase family protein n=1 Tax=Nonomuraea sp. NPDC046570 TaxID=3155255 RepID=UPI0033DB8C03
MTTHRPHAVPDHAVPDHIVPGHADVALGRESFRGANADVVLDHERGLALRYPRHPGGRARLPVLAGMMRAARAHGLPVPEVVEVGGDRLVTTIARGTPLTPGVPVRAEALAGLLDRLATVPAGPGPDPREEWRTLADQVRHRVVPLLAPPAAARVTAEVARALEAASAAPRGFVHGDLGGANVLIEDGQVSAVLDWESAGPGDPAVDFAALTVSVSEATAGLLAARFPDFAERARAYAATFALQEAVHGLVHGDDEAVTAGLAGYLS